MRDAQKYGLRPVLGLPSNVTCSARYGPCWDPHSFGRAAKKSVADKKRNTPMAAERAQNLQDTFLNYVRKNKTPLTICLVNGVKLQGVVTWFDNFCVLLRRDGHSQLVYKHAISTVMPGNPIQLFEPADEGAAADKV
jgi:host factor-I protein